MNRSTVDPKKKYNLAADTNKRLQTSDIQGFTMLACRVCSSAEPFTNTLVLGKIFLQTSKNPPYLFLNTEYLSLPR